MKKLTFTAALAGALLSASAMQAVEISLSLQETGDSPVTASSATGSVSINNTSYDDFTLNTVTGLGTPFYSTPELNLETLNVSSNSLTSSKTLTIELTETGLTPASPSESVLNSFTGILTGVTSETISSYYDPTDTAYGTTDPLATTTFTAAGSNSMNFNGVITASAPYSETEIITATFAAGGPDTLNSSDHITPAVPEPLSMGLLGGGLFGLSLLKFRRRKS